MADHDTIRVEPLAGALGAVVDGVDLRVPLGAGRRDEIRDALMRHLVLFFRDQDLSEDEQLEFASNFGAPVSASVNTIEASDAPMFVTLSDSAEDPPKSDRWHTDVPFVAAPPDVAVLSMRVAPEVGGDTLWASLYAAYEALSPTMQELVSRLDVDLDLGTSAATIREMYGEAYYQQVMSHFKGARHPIVPRPSGHRAASAVPVRFVHARYRRHAPSRKRRCVEISALAARQPQCSMPVALATVRPGHVG